MTLLTVASLAFLLKAEFATAGVQILAITGDAQPGAPSAQLQSIAAPALNDAGQAAFLATLKTGIGGVTANNNVALWRIDGGVKQSLARKGVGGASGAGSDTFQMLNSVMIDNQGTIAISATLQGGDQGVWQYATGGSSLVALDNSSAVPGITGAKYEAFLGGLVQSTAGAVVLNGKLAIGLGGVTSSTDRGVWSFDGASASLVTRGGVTDVPGVPGAQFSAPTAFGVNGSGQIAAIGSLRVIGGVTSQNSLGVWRLNASGGDLIARRGSGDVDGVTGGSFESFDNPSINAQGHIALGAGLAVLGEVDSANNKGIWRADGAGNQMVVRSGVGGVAGVTGADFAAFGTPLINDADQILFHATLAAGVGGVSAANSRGLWMADDSGLRLVARSGSGGVPGVAGASFGDFGTLALNGSGVAAVRGTLAAGAAGVTAGNDAGLWLLDSHGGGVLVAREGDVLAGRTVADLDFAGGSGGSDGHVRSLNSAGQLLFKATFTNGDEGLFLYSPAPSADFNSNGSVTATDLGNWKGGFGAKPDAALAQGDADRDGDVDGADFLLWQRQLSTGVAVNAAPEPASGAMLLFGAAVVRLRFSRGSTSRGKPHG